MRTRLRNTHWTAAEPRPAMNPLDRGRRQAWEGLAEAPTVARLPPSRLEVFLTNG